MDTRKKTLTMITMIPFPKHIQILTHVSKKFKTSKVSSSELNLPQLINNKSGSFSKQNIDSIISFKKKKKKICRICLEEESPQKELISPCFCKGTSQYIHEMCLKQWIECSINNKISLTRFFQQVSNPKCEVCKFEYVMKFIFINHFSFVKFKEGLRKVLLGLLIISIIIFGISGIILLAIIKVYKGLTSKGKILIYSHFFAFDTILTIVLAFIINWKKITCHIKILDKWKIYNFNSPEVFEELKKRKLRNLKKVDNKEVKNSNAVLIGVNQNNSNNFQFTNHQQLQLTDNRILDTIDLQRTIPNLIS